MLSVISVCWNLVEILNEQEKRIFGLLLLNYKEVFALDETNLGRTPLVRHKIETGDHLPIKQSSIRIPLAKQTEVENLMQNMANRSVPARGVLL